jgi:diguanylate cyclase (GGDEF)-like protein
VLYLGGSGDPAASSAQAQVATTGPFAVHWVSSVDALSSHLFFTPIELVLLHPDVAAPVAAEALTAAGIAAPVVRVGAPLPGDVHAGFGSVPARVGLVEAVRFELMVDELDRRALPGASGPVPTNEGEGLFEWDLRTDHVAYSDRWESICGPSPTHAESGPDRWFASVDSADLPVLLEAIETHLAGDSPVLEAVYRAAGDGGGRRVRAVAVRDETGEAIRLSGFVTVVEEPAVTADDRYDALTGLLDRASFLKRLEHAVGPAVASTVAVLVVGIDRFSWVNDSYGHAVGDQLLAAMGRRLVDTVRPDDIVARLGGDEFAVLLTGLRERHGAGAAAERVLASTLRRLQLGDIELDVSVSIGVAGAAGAAASGDVLRQAEVARQRAKSLGGSTAVVFDDELEERASARLAMEQELRRSIERGELVVHYQPIVDVESGRLVAVEALVRWDHPQRGLIPPGEFLPLAEESGLVVPLGEYVLEAACRQLQKWRNDGVVGDITVSVNVSARQFTQSDLVEVVARSLAQTGLPPEQLVLEITESTFIANIEAAAAALQEIRRLGVGIHTDDFGTGHAALSYLRTFPVDSLKIDRSFVQGLGSDADSLAFVRAIVGLGHSLGLGVIGEGVETPEQLEILRSLGCEEAQGYYFSPPRPADELLELGLFDAP